MEVLGYNRIDFIILMVDLVHFIEDREGVEESVCPVEEEILHKIDE